MYDLVSRHYYWGVGTLTEPEMRPEAGQCVSGEKQPTDIGGVTACLGQTETRTTIFTNFIKLLKSHSERME